MSDTPETDAAERMAFAQEYMVPTDFARKLERERDQAREALRTLAENGENEIQKLIKERDEAREDAKKSKAYKRVLKVTNAQLKRERDEARELAETYKEYAQLLGDEINSMATVAHFHGWESTRVEQGKFLREKIKQMEESK